LSERLIKIARDRVGAAPGGYTWDAPHAVVPVPESLAQELLAIRGAGFYEYFEELGPEIEEEDLEALPKAQLVERAKSLGLDTVNKTKAQLAEAIIEVISV
jgi:hypothetical protein